MKERCREVLERAYLFLDGEVLSDQERTQIQVHLDECAPCLEHYGLDREIVFVTARLKGKTECPNELRTKIQNLLNEI
jgi:mycothiol system anti-sigma-R factor